MPSSSLLELLSIHKVKPSHALCTPSPLNWTPITTLLGYLPLGWHFRMNLKRTLQVNFIWPSHSVSMHVYNCSIYQHFLKKLRNSEQGLDPRQHPLVCLCHSTGLSISFANCLWHSVTLLPQWPQSTPSSNWTGLLIGLFVAQTPVANIAVQLLVIEQPVAQNYWKTEQPDIIIKSPK